MGNVCKPVYLKWRRSCIDLLCSGLDMLSVMGKGGDTFRALDMDTSGLRHLSMGADTWDSTT